MDGTNTPRINKKGYVVGDQAMRVTMPLPARLHLHGRAEAASRAEQLADLAALLDRRSLFARQGVLEFLEHRLSAIAALVEATSRSCEPFAAFGLIFSKKWLYDKGGRPVQAEGELAPHADRTGWHWSNARPGRCWVWHGRILQISAVHTTVFVPDVVAKAALATCGFEKWKIEAIEDYLQSSDRQPHCGEGSMPRGLRE